MEEVEFKPEIQYASDEYPSLNGAHKIGLDMRKNGIQGWAAFCNARSLVNCNKCVTNGQADKVGCGDPLVRVP